MYLMQLMKQSHRLYLRNKLAYSLEECAVFEF